MVGNRSGVVTRIKKDIPGVLATHCIAHRSALSCCTGADAIPYRVKVQEILNSLFKYFHYSPKIKNMAMLESIQSLFGGQLSRFKQVFHTRWLSFEGSVDAMVINFSGLISVFMEENSGKALSMHKSSHTIRDGEKQRLDALFICDKFVSGMVKNLKDKFGGNSDTQVLTALSNFFNLRLGPVEKKSDVETISDYLLSVGMKGLRDELLNFVRFAHASQSAGNKSVRSSRDMINLALKHKDMYSGSAEVAARFIIAPVSTVECERGFSKQNLVKTCLRNSMSVSALDNLMRISIDGPSLENFDFKVAFKLRHFYFVELKKSDIIRRHHRFLSVMSREAKEKSRFLPEEEIDINEFIQSQRNKNTLSKTMSPRNKQRFSVRDILSQLDGDISDFGDESEDDGDTDLYQPSQDSDNDSLDDFLINLVFKIEVDKWELEDAIDKYDKRLNRLDKVQAILELKIEEDMLSQEIEEAGAYLDASLSFRMRGKKILAGISDKLSARNINVRAGVSASKIDQQILAGISDKLSARNINVRAGVSANKIDRTEERRSRNPTASALPSISEICCVFCSKSGHQSERCKDVQELTVKQRQDKLKFLHLCYRCLGKGHISEGCFAICSHCKGKHNILCCYEYKANNYNYNVIPSNCNSKLLGTKFSSEVQTRESEISNKVDPVNGNHDAAVFHVGVLGSTSHLCTVLQSAKVFVLDKNGPVEATVLFDTGSDDSYVSKSLVKRVNPRWVESEGISCAAFGERGPASHQARGVFGLEVQSRLHGYGGAHELMAVAVQNICAPLFRPKIPFELFENFKNFKLADNLEEAQELEVDTLIGLDSNWSFMTQGFVCLPAGLAAQETVFDWVISGSWKHDKFTPYRYEVALPRKENSSCKLVNHKSLALSRLNQLSKKESQYNKVLFEFEAAAIIGEVKVPPDKFSQWVQGFDILRKWQIPRRYDSTLIWSSIPNLELHGFGDASEKGYGAAIYLRIPCSSAYRTCLVMAKSRVAPLKQMTVPRLELMGALLVARLIMFVKNALHFSDVSIHCWSDSTIVLQWIKGHPSKWKTFIANRIYEIHELTSPDSWSHCSGESNPADLMTRGVSAQNLVDSELWLNGPIWLREKIVEHIKPEDIVQYNYLSEIVYVVHGTPGNLVHQSVFPVYKWGTFLKTIRIMGWVWRFIGNLKGLNNCGSGDLSYDEITLAKLCLFKDVQFTHFNPEIHALKRDQSISKSSPIAKLTPFLGKDGLLRVKRRLDNSNLDYDSKHPIVLSKCYVTKLLVVFQHLLMKHAGVNTVLCALRNSYWITRLSKVELITLLCEIEACINSRPLTFVGDDIEDISPLTPSSFICNNATHTNIEFSEYNTDLNLTHNNLINKYSLCEKQLNLFWSVWTHNYLRNLPPSIKKFQAKGAIEVGALVLIREDHLPRMQWPLGIVVDLYPGRDGLIRSVRIKTSKGEVNRPIQRLHSLEVNRFDNVKMDVPDPLSVVHSPTRDLLERVEVVSIAKDTTTVKTPVKSRAGRVIKPVKRLGLQD
ncbi:hypothetical protein GQR58_015535 [Nymphon striatum]|nr:hypothetical protein GQR58_015535 [Nymphon striatum]